MGKCLIGFFVALSGSVCGFALAVVVGLELSGAGILCRGLTGWRALRRLRP
ncbi:MAG: hypothetical protein OXF50_11545 [Caldilineaceae bacterium]|nr:hypothetical protein [Caldilineaceae bacterium]